MPSVHSINVPQNGIIVPVPVNRTPYIINDPELNGYTKNLTVDIPKSAMAGRKAGLEITVTTFLSWADLPSDEQPLEQEDVKTVAPIVELREDNDSEVHFEDYIKITVPHKLNMEELRFTKVLRSDRGNVRSLPTSIENQDDHEDAYFTVDENYITIYTKTFSIYTCHKGHKDRLNLNAWVFCFYMAEQTSLQIRVVMSDSNPRDRLLTCRGLNPETLVLEKNETVRLPVRCMRYKPKDIMYFLLDKNENWTSPFKAVIIQTNLSNIVECSTCIQRAEVPPSDAAVFELEPREPEQTVSEFQGVLYSVLEPLKQSENDSMTPNLWEELNDNPDVMKWINEAKRNAQYGVTSLPLKISSLLRSQATNSIKLKPGIKGGNQPLPVETKWYGKLTDQHLDDLSQWITSQDHLRKLAIEGLDVDKHKIDRHLNQNNTSMPTIVSSVLTDWRMTQPNQEIAFYKLCEALEKVDMQFFIEEVLKRLSKRQKIDP